MLPHAKRDAIIVVETELDLSEVAVAIAEDNTALVQGWIGDRSISKPTSEQLYRLEQYTPKTIYHFNRAAFCHSSRSKLVSSIPL